MTAINRVAGMFSGLDTETIISDLMKAARAPEDRLKQSKQTLEWKQADLRTVNTSLLSLYNSTFDMKLSSSFTTRKTNSTNENVVTAVAKAGVSVGTYDINVSKVATIASNQTFSALGKGVVLGDAVTVPVAIATGSNDTFEVYLEDAGSPGTGSITSITLDAGTYSTVDDLVTQINTKVAASALNGKVTVTATDDKQIKLVAKENAATGFVPKLRVGYSTSAGIVNKGLDVLSLKQEGLLESTAITAPIDTTGANTFVISYGGEDFTITLPEKSYASVAALATDMQTQVDNLLGPNVLTVTANDQKLRIGLKNGISGTGNLPTLQIKAPTSKSALSLLRFADKQASASPNTINSEASLYSQRNKFRNSVFGYTSSVTASNPFGWLGSTASEIADHKFGMTINGETYQIDSDTATLSSVLESVNSDPTTGVRIFYESTADKISVSTTATGNTNGAAGGEISVAGGFFTGILGIDASKEKGGDDAVFTVNGLEITSASNEYTLNGVTFQLLGKSADATTTARVSIVADVDSVVTKVKAYIENYNSILDTLSKKISEARVLDDSKQQVKPLTDDERQQLKDSGKEDNIQTWQDNARKGNLRNNQSLIGVYNDLRKSASSIVEGGTGEITVTVNGTKVTTQLTSLSQIGITTKGYTSGSSNNGKLELNENTLREALASNPDAVSKLFTQEASQELVLDSSGNPTFDAYGNVKTTTNNETAGIAVRLYDALQTAMDKITEEAGSEGSYYWSNEIGRSINQIDNRIYDMEDRLDMLEDRYWKQYTALETYLSRAQAQSSWLTQQMGGSSSSQ